MNPPNLHRKVATSDELLLCLEHTSWQRAFMKLSCNKSENLAFRSQFHLFSKDPLSLIQSANSFRLTCKEKIKSAKTTLHYPEKFHCILVERKTAGEREFREGIP